MTFAELDVILRWTSGSIGLTGYGWVLILTLCLWFGRS